MIEHIAFKISNIFGLCKNSKMPGTIASFMALIFSFLTYYFLGKGVYVFLLFVFLIVSFWSIKTVQKKLGIGDHQSIGIDEWAGMWIANMFLFEIDFHQLEKTFLLALGSFIVFRVIDILKFIPPIKAINEKKEQNAYAVLFDDVLAGFYTYFIILVLTGFYDINYLYFSLMILSPGMIANATPVFLKMKFWSAPISARIFGTHKTWRGFLGAIIAGTLSFVLLVKYGVIMPKINPHDLAMLILVGFLFALGAIGGDLVKSFFKRKNGIPPGEGFAPWDQIDHPIGMLLLTYPFYQYSFDQIVFMIIFGGAVSAITHRLGYFMKINTAKQ